MRAPDARFVASLAAVCALVIGAPVCAYGQAEVQGKVLGDSGRRPVANAEVAIARLGLRAMTDSLGRYRLRDIPRGEHVVITRRSGSGRKRRRPRSTATRR